MAVATLKPTAPDGLPPPSVIPDPSHPLWIAYALVHEKEDKKPEEEKLGGDEYVAEVMKVFNQVKDEQRIMHVVDGEVFVEVEVDEEEDHDMEVDSELFQYESDATDLDLWGPRPNLDLAFSILPILCFPQLGLGFFDIAYPLFSNDDSQAELIAAKRSVLTPTKKF